MVSNFSEHQKLQQQLMMKRITIKEFHLLRFCMYIEVEVWKLVPGGFRGREKFWEWFRISPSTRSCNNSWWWKESQSRNSTFAFSYVHWSRGLKIGTRGFSGARKILGMVSNFSEHQKLQQQLMMKRITIKEFHLLRFPMYVEVEAWKLVPGGFRGRDNFWECFRNSPSTRSCCYRWWWRESQAGNSTYCVKPFLKSSHLYSSFNMKRTPFVLAPGSNGPDYGAVFALVFKVSQIKK